MVIKNAKKYFKLLFLLGILLLSVGCTTSEETGTNTEGSESEQNIRTFLQKLLTGPDEEQEKLLTGPDENVEKYVKRLAEYHNENFKPYLSEQFFESFLDTNGPLLFLQMAHPDNELEVENITFDESEDYYTFTVKVAYSDKGSNESKTMNIKGNAQTNEEDEVTSVHYINAEELRTALN